MNDPALTATEKAFFSIPKKSLKIAVDFNPTALQIGVQNQMKGEGEGKAQYVSSSSAKLDLELVFDSTDTGEDVRKRTHRIEQMMQPDDTKTPPMVKFEWGAFAFSGVVDSFKQTLDFFSRDGVPLRAAVTLSLAQPDYVFDQEGSDKKADVDDTLDVPGGSAFGLAVAGGDVFAARFIASANGLESLRAEAGGSLSVSGGISIGAAAGFSAGAGASVGLSANAGGAFGGLQIGNASLGTGAKFDPGKVLAATSPPTISAGASFDVSGKASLAGGSSFRADVTGGVQFDEI